jgi:hypothetical protein
VPHTHWDGRYKFNEDLFHNDFFHKGQNADHNIINTGNDENNGHNN